MTDQARYGVEHRHDSKTKVLGFTDDWAMTALAPYAIDLLAQRATGQLVLIDQASVRVVDRRVRWGRQQAGAPGSAGGDVDTDEVAALEEVLRRDWLSPQEATQLAGVSYGWLRQLGERGRIAKLATPLGRLYRRADAEQIRAARADRTGAKSR